MSKKEADAVDFETSMNELSQVVEAMEAGGLSLEDALKKFEKGIQLTQQCQKTLKDAEQRVYQLIEKEGQASLVETALEEEN